MRESKGGGGGSRRVGVSTGEARRERRMEGRNLGGKVKC